MLTIDAPEKNQSYGDVSTQGLVELLTGKTVTIEYEKRDRYKRIVGKVLVNPSGDVFCLALDCVKKIDAGLEQVKAGLAWHYKYTRWSNLKKTEGYTLKLKSVVWCGRELL